MRPARAALSNYAALSAGADCGGLGSDGIRRGRQELRPRRKHGVEREWADFLKQEGAESLHGGHVLANLRALEEVSAVQAGAQDEVPLQERLGAQENIRDLLLYRIHAQNAGGIRWGM